MFHFKLNGNRVAAYPMLYFLFFLPPYPFRVYFTSVLDYFTLFFRTSATLLYFIVCSAGLFHIVILGGGGVILIGRTLRTEPFNKSFL